MWSHRPWLAGVVAIVVASAQPGPATIVSAASYQAVVAPNSLASIFGAGLASSTASAQLDANGQLPTLLAGTTVEVNGEAAALIYVSPSQINFVMPADTALGAADVVVRSAIGAPLHSSAQVANTAPALFSLDASGSGPGAILNAVTYAAAPFLVETQQNAGTDKQTRLSLYGTGIRYAGNPTHDPTAANVAAQVTAQTRNASGPNFKLNVEYAGVEYAGAAPGFFGLDQINIVLPPDLDGAGAVSVAISAENGASNVVTFQLGSLPASAIRLAALTLSPTFVNGGDSVFATVSLNAPARTTGFNVSLKSSSGAAQPPFLVNIPAGQVSAVVTIPTISVITTQTVTITAQAGTVTQTAALEITPANALQLTSFAIAPASIQGGRNLSATATMSGQATAGGVTIQIASDNAAVKPPATLAIPFGQTSATISIPTSLVNTPQTASLTATYGRNTQTSTITVNPPFVLALSDSSVTGGVGVTGSITLAEPAGISGLTISLKSTDTSVQVPAVVSIAANQSTASFAINTTTVTASRSATISATSPSYAGFTQSVSLAVNQPSAVTLSNLTISPAVVSGGVAATGMVTLTAAAPAGGLVVTLKTNAPFYTQIPLVVTVQAGLTGSSFQISTTTVPSAQTVTITATYGGVSKAATLKIQ
jgi:uncharacterized protein (TIGR03437 family)